MCARTLAIAGSLATAGCYVAELDPELGDAFACEIDDDCPVEGFCVNRRCHVDEPPAVSILAPEDEQELAWIEGSDAVELTATIQGTDLALQGASGAVEHFYGEGRLVVTVDGVVAVELDEGPLSAGIAVPLAIANVPGAHRIAVQVRRNDGVAYDNASATATRLVWIDDDRPHVAIKSPSPGAVFSTDVTDTEVVLATIDFTMVAPDSEVTPGAGHAHVYYDVAVEQCLDPDPAKDCVYQAVIPVENQPFAIQLPGGAEEQTTLSAILRSGDHSPVAPAVSDTIAIARVEGP